MTTADRFILFAGHGIKPWVYTEQPVSREEAVALLASGEVETFHSALAYDTGAGTSRDATNELLNAARDFNADRDMSSYAFAAMLELHLGTRAARPFFTMAERA